MGERSEAEAFEFLVWIRPETEANINRMAEQSEAEVLTQGTCLNIFRSVYGTRFTRSSNSPGGNQYWKKNI